jgi:hypothetical protein
MAHPAHRTRPREASIETLSGLCDLGAEWLLENCPFSALIVLTTLVIGRSVEIPSPMILAFAAPTADLLIRFARAQRAQRSAPGATEPATASRATA